MLLHPCFHSNITPQFVQFGTGLFRHSSKCLPPPFSPRLAHSSIIVMMRMRLGNGELIQDRLAFVHIHTVHTNVHAYLFSRNGFVKTVNHDAARAFVRRIVGLRLIQQLARGAVKINVSGATEQTTREAVLFLEQVEGNECRTAAGHARINVDQITASSRVEEHVNAEKAPEIE